VTEDAGAHIRITELAERLDRLNGQVTGLAGVVAAMAEDDDQADGDEEDGERQPYRPAPSMRWWELRGDDRDAAIARLRAWAQDIYGSGYGHLAAALPPCWAEHDLCLYALDALSELWMVLYLQPKRSLAALAGQAEFQTRTLPLYVAQMAAEAKGCGHGRRAAR